MIIKDRSLVFLPADINVGESSRRRDPVEASGILYKFVISYIYSLVCNGIRLIPSQTNVRLGFCDNQKLDGDDISRTRVLS